MSKWGGSSLSQDRLVPRRVEYQPKTQGPKKTDIGFNIPGVTYLKEWFPIEEEKEIIRKIDQAQWSHDLKRRVQQYGFRFDYVTGDIDPIPADPFPDYVESIANRLHFEGHFPSIPNQIIINEYLPGQGINPHVDKLCFDEPICSISLLSGAVMDFRHKRTMEKKSLYLEPRSLLLLKQEARYQW
jgi:alkylated DNA repair dioxygenase AlkB